MRAYDSLTGDAEFARVRRRGRRADGKHVSIVVAPVPPARERSRIAIVPAKGLGGAVERNRVRRRTRAALEAVGVGGDAVDMILIARASAQRIDYAELCDDVRATLRRLGR